MAIAKQNLQVTRGYKPKHARALKSGPNGLHRIVRAPRQYAREMIDFGCDEIAHAMIDTLRLLEYLRWTRRREARTRVAPVRHDREPFVHDLEPVNKVSAFTVEQVNSVNVRTFER